MSDYRAGTVDKYVGDLASNLPAPGGGSGAALAGALGNALAAMVGNFTIGKDKFADVEDQVQGILEGLGTVRERLLELVDEDVAVYGKVSAAYKLPRDTDEQKAERSEAIENACKAAAGVPRAIAEACDRSIELAAELCDIGNPNLISDVGCAVKLAEASYIAEQRKQEPILLLDDVLSELDASRRAHVLGWVARYQQCFITATEVDSIEERFLSGMHTYVVRRGRVEPVGAPAGR